MINVLTLIVVAPLLVASLWGWSRVLRSATQGRAPLQLESRRQVPWSILDLCFCVAVFTMLQMIGGAIVRGAYDLDPATELDQLPLQPRAVAMLVGGIATLLTTLISIVAVMWHTRATWRDIGFDGRFIAKDLRIGLWAFVLLAPPVYGIQLLLVQWLPSQHPLINLLKENPEPGFLAITGFTALVVAPLTEEYFFRVLFQGWLQKVNSNSELLSSWFYAEAKQPPPSDSIYVGGPYLREPDREDPDPSIEDSMERAGAALGVWPIFASAFVFSLLHASHGPDPFPLFLLAVGLGYLYRQTHRILPCIVVHLLLNLCSLIALFLSIAQAD